MRSLDFLGKEKFKKNMKIVPEHKLTVIHYVTEGSNQIEVFIYAEPN